MQNHFGYMNLMSISDIALDVYPFGGCNSSFEAFSLNIPIITQPSIMINGRFTSGFYKKMGLEKYICNSKKEYIKMGIKLGMDKKYRTKVSNDIKDRNKILFEDMETIQEWKNDMIRIIKN
jgi:predicted O-linked N-acetylglucosamine transferase (SPINDLY family)